MKTKPFHLLCAAAALVALFAFQDPALIKRITDANFKYEFYTTREVSPVQDGKTYYWFKGGAIHSAQSGMAGELLHGPYLKLYLSNQVAEQGGFNNGLKSGVWKTWFPNGTLETRQYWNNGYRMDTFLRYGPDGSLLEKGNYRRDQKHGRWIDYTTHDTVVYKRGVVWVPKPKMSKAEKKAARDKKAALKKERRQLRNAAKKAPAQEKTTPAKPGGKTTGMPAKPLVQKKPGSKQPDSAAAKPKGFFKRLFGSKKKTNPESNAKGE